MDCITKSKPAIIIYNISTSRRLTAPRGSKTKQLTQLFINQTISIMKKLIYCAAALATALFAGSCQQEMLDTTATETTVTYTVALPDAQTKAIGDAATVDQLIYEVWKTEGAGERDLKGTKDGKANATRLYQDQTALVQRNGKTCAVVTFNLVQDQEYTILFWAQKAGKGVYDTSELTDVHYAEGFAPGSSEYFSNQENYAAFYAASFVSDVDSKSRTVTLKRPFAQLNIATKNTVKDYTVAMNTSKVTISDVATHFDVAMNRPEETAVTVPASFEFKTADVPADPAKITVNGQVYDYVAMNYVFAMGPNVTVDYEINTTLTAKNLDGTNGETTSAQIKHTVLNVPLKENYRTNIVGNLLSSTTEYYIEIDDSWYDEPGDGTEVEVWDGLYAQEPPKVNGVYQISLASELAWLAKAVNGTLVDPNANVTKSTGYIPARNFSGETFVLTQDIDLSHDVDVEGNRIDYGPALWTPIGVRGNKPFEGTFDGQGFTIKNLNVDMDKIVENQRNIQSDLIVKANDGAGLFGSCKRATVKNVTIKNATVKGHYKAAAVVADANCTYVDNCHVEDATIISTPYNNDDANNAGAIVGYLVGEAAWAMVTDCSVKNSDVTAYRDVAAVVGRTNQKTQVLRNTVTNVEVVADQTPAYKEKKVGNAGKVIGYDVTNNCVMEGNVVDDATTAVVKVNTAANLEYQINNAAADVVVVFASDISGDITVDQQENKNVVIDGNGKKYDGKITIEGNNRSAGAETVTIKNVNFETDAADRYFIEQNVAKSYAHNITVENCTFKGNETSVGARFRQCYNIVFKDCKVKAGHSLAQLYSCSGVTVDNATINAKSGISFGTSTDVVMTNSTVVATGRYGYAVRVDADGARTATISNSTLTAGAPVLMRKATAEYTMNLTGNTLNTTEVFQVIVTASDYDDEKVMTVPTGEYDLNADADYVVYPTEEGLSMAKNSAELTAVAGELKEGDVLKVMAATYTFPTLKANVTIECEEGTVFEGTSSLNIAGSTVIGATFSNPTGSAVKGTINGTFTDCVFTGSNGLRECYVGETCEFNECVFSGDVYGAHFDGSSKTITFNDCEFSGFNAFAAAIELVTFNGCTFKGNGKSGYNGANMWGSAKFIDTEFTFDGTTSNEWIDAIGVDKTYEFTRCTVNGSSILNSSKIFSRNVGTKVTVDGVEYTRADGYFVAGDNAVVTNAAALTAALNAEVPEITLAPGTYEGTFAPKVATSITSASASNKSVIAGRVNVGSIDCSFENIKFEITDASKHKNTYSGAPYKYPGIVVAYAAAMTFEGCDFESSISAGVCGINAGNHADSSDLLTVNNCTFVGDFYAIRTRSLCNITNNVFDIYTDQGTLAAVWTWGNDNSGANMVTFTGNTNQNANQVYSVQMTASNFVYDYVTINVQNNTNFCALADGVIPARFNGTHTFVEGSETF